MVFPEDYYRELNGRMFLYVWIADGGRAPNKGSGTLHGIQGNKGWVKKIGHHLFELIPLAKLTLWHSRNNSDRGGPRKRAA